MAGDVVQAYDFLELSRRHKAVLQLGGWVGGWGPQSMTYAEIR